MQTLLIAGVVVYVIGFILTCGVLSALWGWDKHPGALVSAIVWPLFVPIALVTVYTKRYIKARTEREKLLREIESEL